MPPLGHLLNLINKPKRIKLFTSFLLLWALCSVLGTALSAVCYASGIKRTADDVITNTRKVLYTTSTNQDNTMLLQVVSFSGDVAVYFL